MNILSLKYMLWNSLHAHCFAGGNSKHALCFTYRNSLHTHTQLKVWKLTTYTHSFTYGNSLLIHTALHMETHYIHIVLLLCMWKLTKVSTCYSVSNSMNINMHKFVNERKSEHAGLLLHYYKVSESSVERFQRSCADKLCSVVSFILAKS